MSGLVYEVVGSLLVATAAVVVVGVLADFFNQTSSPKKGRPSGKYVMYHGTTRKNAKSILRSGFKRSSRGMLGPGVYLTRDLDKASLYPKRHPDDDKVIIKVKVKVGKVKAIKYQGHPLQKTWHDHGYDTAWVPPNCGMVRSDAEEDCVWDPSRIKVLSVTTASGRTLKL